MVSKSWKKMLLILVEYQKFSAYQIGKGTALSRTLHINFQLFLGFNRLVENALTQKTRHQTVEERAAPPPPTPPPPPPTETFQKEFEKNDATFLVCSYKSALNTTIVVQKACYVFRGSRISEKQ